MEILSVLIRQIIIMFILMGIGYLFYKKGLITNQGSKDIGKILLYLVIPVVVVNNFRVERTTENVMALLYSGIISLICMILAMIISHFLLKKDPIGNFSSCFSNAGFIGLPLVGAVLGSSAGFYISIFIVLVNALQWTYGIFVMTGDASVMQPKKVLTNPIVISVVIGLILFVTQISLPSIVVSTMSLITGLNTPLAMMMCGVYLAQTDLVKMLGTLNNYKVSIVRLVIIPLASIAVIYFIPFGNETLKLAILIAAAAPVGSNVSVFAQQYDKDYASAAEQVCMSTLLCLVSLPLIVAIATKLL